MKKLIKRPFSTHYYSSANTHTRAFTSYGAASTEQGAIRAAIVRVFLGQWEKAIIHDRATGVALYHITPGPGGLRVRYGSGVEFKRWSTDAGVNRAHA